MLKSWRDAIHPHDDVLEGDFQAASFALRSGSKGLEGAARCRIVAKRSGQNPGKGGLEWHAQTFW